MNVVIIENNQPDAELLAEYASEAFAGEENDKASISVFVNPNQAIEYIEENGCDILLSDAVLCGTDGLILMRNIQQTLPKVSIVITTVYEEYLAQAIQMRIRLAGYLPLPTTKEKVKTQIDDIVSYISV